LQAHDLPEVAQAGYPLGPPANHIFSRLLTVAALSGLPR